MKLYEKYLNETTELTFSSKASIRSIKAKLDGMDASTEFIQKGKIDLSNYMNIMNKGIGVLKMLIKDLEKENKRIKSGR